MKEMHVGMVWGRSADALSVYVCAAAAAAARRWLAVSRLLLKQWRFQSLAVREGLVLRHKQRFVLLLPPGGATLSWS